MPATVAKGHDVPNLLRAAYGRHTSKAAARAAGVPHETARNWLRGRATPSADTLLRMADACDRFATALETYLDARRAARLARTAAAGAGGMAAQPGAQVTK